jgi:DNA-binding SARP family transcriptional activator
VPPRARLVLLGALELERDGEPVPLPASARRLLAFTALHGRPLSRVYVAGALWLDSESDARAAASLRSALWRLHRAAGEVVRADAHELSLAPWVEVDLHRVSAVAHEVLAGRALHPDLVRQLAWADELLPDWYDEWVESERERFRQLRLHALERLCERLYTAGRFDDALEAGLAAVSAEPLRESAHRAMIGMHLAEGNVCEAVRQYDTCERLMSRELGVRPSRKTLQLVEGFR